jgi:putative ATP-dependent endonuclease of the OLD family
VRVPVRRGGPGELTLEKLTFSLGPNGTGKTAFLHALARMFGSEPGLRRLVPGDFHVPRGETPGVGIAPSLWLEADFAFPELAEDQPQPTVPPHFAHMRMETDDGVPTVRFRLTGELDEDGEVTQELAHVLAVDNDDKPTRTVAVNRFDRGVIQVHYLPARRDPADHVSYAANSLLGRLLRAADWKSERDSVTGLGQQISDTLAATAAITGVASGLATQWRSMHTGAFLTNPRLSFVRGGIEAILRYVTIEFAPGPGQPVVDFSLLSDGQLSLLYISLVLTAQAIGREVLAGRLTTFDVDRLRPPVFTLLAVEEPENSLSPHYLGRVLAALSRMADGHDAQAVVATHSPSLMRRVEPAQVRYLRLEDDRRTKVATVAMPDEMPGGRRRARQGRPLRHRCEPRPRGSPPSWRGRPGWRYPVRRRRPRGRGTRGTPAGAPPPGPAPAGHLDRHPQAALGVSERRGSHVRAPGVDQVCGELIAGVPADSASMS